jgi:outer membrane receptor protein involved in Fe transport
MAGTEGIIHTGIGPLDVQRGSTFKYGRLTYTRDRLKFQAFVNALDGESPPLLLRGPGGGPPEFRFENQAYDVEFSNLHLFGSRHLVSYGGNFRHNRFDLSFAGRGGNRDEGGVYVQDQIFLSEQFRWIVGGRVDRFDVLKKAVFSPRTAFLFKPGAKQTFRISYNRAFRAPSFVNTLLETSLVSEIDLWTGTPFPVVTAARGNPELREEALKAYEAGYIGDFGPVVFGAALYLNHTENMIQFTSTGFYTSTDPPGGWPVSPGVLDLLMQQGRGLPSRYSYLNFARVSDRGVELSADLAIRPGWSAFANYTWQGDPRTAGVEANDVNLPPTHRVNAGVSVSHGRFFGSFSGSFVDEQFWQDVGIPGSTAAYTLLDGGLGVHSTDGSMTIALRAKNLLNTAVQQHVFGDLIRRTLTGEVRFAF